MAMGPSIEVGAVMAVENRCDVQEIDTKDLVRRLIELGVKGIGSKEL